MLGAVEDVYAYLDMTVHRVPEVSEPEEKRTFGVLWRTIANL